ncbi:hypothetical protein CRENBAI_011991 [Crenichthys baileyi]|uniref:Uncharacterized protein n=1 Tax=Crenichthys baileyi TaxID=28760 RepID=A0AAV9RFN5_9TELE
MAIHLRRLRIQEKARHVDKDKLNMKLRDMHERFASKERKPTWKGKSSDLAISQKAELQYRQFSTVERAHQTPALLSLRADNMGPSYLLGASEPPLLPLNELQRGDRIDRNTEEAASFDWRSCQGFQIVAAVSSAWSQPQASPQPPTKLPLFLASSQASCLCG